MTDSNPLILYDISSPFIPRSYAPNPSKARLALSFKRVPFKTNWVDITEIPDVRQGLKCEATRKLADGTDYYTLPMLQESDTGKVIGDSFDIANYLDDTFPESGAGLLFPPDSTRTGLDYESPNKDTMFFAPITSNMGKKNYDYAKFNVHVDTTFSAHVILFGHNIPFNPKTAELAKAMMCKRAHLNSWDDARIEGEAREQLKVAFKMNTKSLADLFTVHEDGPYLEGKQANYADLIVGGWLNFCYSTMSKEDWEDFRTWHNGVFAKLYDALMENYFECK